MSATTQTQPDWVKPEDMALAPGAPALVEASAGTGKTWQISDMVLRLVVDHGVDADAVLVITFTKAATAELRDRVRGRLALARRVLQGEEEPKAGDLTLTRLASLADRVGQSDGQADGQSGGLSGGVAGGQSGGLSKALALRRVSAALERFDQLTISTIHGFCQSTLTRLAFESGRGEVSEVSTDEGDLLDELVRDTLQDLYLRGTRLEVPRLAAMGLEYENLLALGRAMLAAEEPRLLLGEQDTADAGAARCAELPGVRDFDHLAAAAEIAEQEEAFIQWWGTDEAQACRDAFFEKGAFSKGFSEKMVQEVFDRLEMWLRPGATVSWTKDTSDTELNGDGPHYENEPKLRRVVVETRLKPKYAETFAGWPLVERFEALYTAREAWQRRVVPQAQAWFACRVREAIHGALRRRGRLTYATMLSDLAEALEEQGPDGALAQAMRERHKVVLVDEFQDTDGAQWRILKTAFAHSESRLILVGDPKQAIYSFRGADLDTYLQAAGEAQERGALSRNYRADGEVVGAVNHLFGPPTWGLDPAGEGDASSPFGRPGLAFSPVEAKHPPKRWRQGPDAPHRPPHRAPHRPPHRPLHGAPHGAPHRAAVELRWVDVNELGAGSGDGKRKKGSKKELWPVVAEACAEEIAALLQAEPPVEVLERVENPLDNPPIGAPKERYRPLRPGDITVLVHTHSQAADVRRQLSQRGVPSVAVERKTVFSAAAARWVLQWIEAVADPADEKRARAAASSPLFGWTAQQLGAAMEAREVAREAARDEDHASRPAGVEALALWEQWVGSLKEAADHWAKWGFARTFEEALAAGQPAWVASAPPPTSGTQGGRDALKLQPAPCDEVLPEGLEGPEGTVGPEANEASEEGTPVWGAAATLFAAEGERHATDLRHLTELLQAEERTRRTGPEGLALWLRERIHEAEQGTEQGDADEQTVRLETDADAVQVATIHASKGLEYGVVMLPTVGLAKKPTDNKRFLAFRGPSGQVLDLRAAASPGGAESLAAQAQAEDAEAMRVLYVALTRAKHHVVAWLTNVENRQSAPPVELSPLGRLVFGRVGVTEKTAAVADDPQGLQTAYEQVLERLARASKGVVAWSVQRRPGFTRFTPDDQELLHLETTPWPADRRLGGVWRVSSFSGLSKGRGVKEDEPQRPEEWAAAQAAAAGTMPDSQVGGAEAVSPVALSGDEAPLEVPGGGAPGSATAWDTPLGFDGLRGGINTGHWIHGIFEELDFQTRRGKTGEPLEDLVRRLGLRFGARDEGVHALVADALPQVLATPLDGGVTGLPPGFTLGDIPVRDRLDELRFDLRLGAGASWAYHHPQRDVRVDYELARDALARAARSSQLGAAPWLKGVLDDLEKKAREAKEGEPPPTLFGRTAGIMTGSIDLAFRVPVSSSNPDPDRPGHEAVRYYVADYKTNLIGPEGARRLARLGHYSQAWLGWEMAGHAYHLQALIYTVALHRMLRVRLGEQYDYDRHMGGHLYLFVRGMVGAEAPRDGGLAAGVWSDRWPREVVEAVDAAFYGTARDVAGDAARDGTGVGGEGTTIGRGGQA